MGCDGDCKCGEKKDKVEFDRLAELKKFISSDSVALKLAAILPNDDKTILQFSGWSINLYKDGKWIVTDTSGG